MRRRCARSRAPECSRPFPMPWIKLAHALTGRMSARPAQELRHQVPFRPSASGALVFGGVDRIVRLLSDLPAITPACERMPAEIGSGHSRYAAHQRTIAPHVCDWLAEALLTG